MPAYVIGRTNNQMTPARVWKLYQANYWGGLCPWVRVYNLFASVTFTGNSSWEQLAVDLHNLGQSSIVILAGRHGDQLGQQLDDKGHFVHRGASLADTAINPIHDQYKAEDLADAFPNMDIRVIDVGGGEHDTITDLQNEMRTHLALGRIVILAWCYSLFAMKEGWMGSLRSFWANTLFAVPRPIFDPLAEDYGQKQYFSARSGPWAAADQTQIDVIAQDWNWVGVFPERVASKAIPELPTNINLPPN